MVITAIICIAIVVVLICVILAVLLYNTMLLLNEHNKRLLALTKESLDHERDARDELSAAKEELNALYNERQEPNDNNPEDEETFHDPDLD